MNCETALEAWVAELAGEPADDKARQHITGCASCKEKAASFESLWTDLGELPEMPVPATLRHRVEALAAQAPQQAHRKQETDWRTRLRGWLPAAPAWRTGPMFAALALGVVAGAFWERGASHGAIAALRHEVQSTRALVALSLLQQRTPAERLQGVSWSARVEHPDPEVIGALLETLSHDTSIDVRLAAVDALASVGTVPAVRTGLMQALENQSSPLVQIAVIDALMSLHEPRAGVHLQKIAGDARADSTVRTRARAALRQLGS